MGFGLFKKTKVDSEPLPSKKKTFGKSNSAKHGEQLEMKFEPSTKEEIKGYKRAAAKHDEAKKEKKNIGRKERLRMMKLDLDKNLPFRFKKPKAFRRVFKEIMRERHKKHIADKNKNPQWGPKMPKYEMYEPQKLADSNFVHDFQTTLSGMSWAQLTRLIHAAAGGEIPTKDWSEAFHTVQNIVHQSLGVELDSTSTRYRLVDRDAVLEEWDIEIVQRKRKMPKAEVEEKKVKKVRRAKKEEEEIEDEDAEEETEDGDDEEEEEKPVKKSKKKKKAAKDVSEDEEDESVEDDDDDAEEEEESDDDEEEESENGDEEDEEEDSEEPDDEDEEESDDEDDEDEKPKVKKVKGKKTVAKSKKTEKTVAKKPAKAAKEKTSKAKAVKITDTSLVKLTSKQRTAGGQKGELRKLVTKKGIAYKKLLALAEEAGLPLAKVKKWVPGMAQMGYFEIG